MSFDKRCLVVDDGTLVLQFDFENAANQITILDHKEFTADRAHSFFKKFNDELVLTWTIIIITVINNNIILQYVH